MVITNNNYKFINGLKPHETNRKIITNVARKVDYPRVTGKIIIKDPLE